MIVADSDKSIRARLFRLRWRLRYLFLEGPQKTYTRLICATFGCVWHEAKWEPQKFHDYRTLRIAAHRTCSRCLRNTLTFHDDPGGQP